MLQKINKESFGNPNAINDFCLIFSEITPDVVQQAIQWIIMANMEEENPPTVLNLFINSPGGDLYSAFALIDVMRASAIPVRTIGIGQIASAGLLIFMSGSKGERIITPNTSIMSHQFSSGNYGKAFDLYAIEKEHRLTEERMFKMYEKCTGMTRDKIKKVLLPAQDVFLTSDEAIKYGICDKVRELK